MPSALLAAVAARQADIPVLLVNVLDPGADARPVRRLATRLAVGVAERHVRPAERAATARELVATGDSALATPAMVELALAMRTAGPYGPRLLVPTAADELFSADPAAAGHVGDPHATWRATEDRLAKLARVQLRYPFLDKGMVGWVAALPRAVKHGRDGLPPIWGAALDRLEVPWARNLQGPSGDTPGQT